MGGWRGNVFFSHGTSDSAGVMILFNWFSGNVINHTSDISGHWLVMLVIQFNGVNYILLCVYGYNRSAQNKLFYSSLSWLLEGWKVTSTTDKIITGGNFNLVPDLWLDCLPPKGQCHYYEEIINKANTVIFQFMWRNKAHYIRRSQLVKEYDKGGIKAPEFESMAGTFRTDWIKSCPSQPNSMRFHIPRFVFQEK